MGDRNRADRNVYFNDLGPRSILEGSQRSFLRWSLVQVGHNDLFV